MDRPSIVLWYNPACSKCRGAKQLLEEAGCDVEIFPYLTQPPDAERLTDMLALLGAGPRAVLRSGADPALDGASDEAIFAALLKDPSLIQRPIAIRRDVQRAVVARPPELALSLLNGWAL